MKKKFSISWKSSKQPRKQRKYVANAPLHLKRKFISVNLSKELRKNHEKRNVPLRKGDKVKIMRGKFKNKQGKVVEIKIKTLKIFVENIQTKKQDNSKVNVPLRASNLQIVELNLDDKRRFKTTIKSKNIEEKKKETPKIKKIEKESKK